MTPHVIWTLRAMARRLGVAEEETVIAYAMRPRDPLRIQCQLGKYWIKTDVLDAFRVRGTPGNDSARVVGREDITGRLDRSWNTVKGYARRPDDPLPIHGLGGPNPWVYESAMLDWFHAQNQSARSVWLTALLKNSGTLSRDEIVIPLALTPGKSLHSAHARERRHRVARVEPRQSVSGHRL